MKLSEAISSYKSQESKKTKKDILEQYREDILEMISLGIPLKTQITLILENTEIEKIQYAEYYNILKKHFGYEGKSKGKKVFETKLSISSNKQKSNKSTTDLLSEDVDLLGMHLSKQ